MILVPVGPCRCDFLLGLYTIRLVPPPLFSPLFSPLLSSHPPSLSSPPPNPGIIFSIDFAPRHTSLRPRPPLCNPNTHVGCCKHRPRVVDPSTIDRLRLTSRTPLDPVALPCRAPAYQLGNALQPRLFQNAAGREALRSAEASVLRKRRVSW
jgi:hypothetical protein